MVQWSLVFYFKEMSLAMPNQPNSTTTVDIVVKTGLEQTSNQSGVWFI